MSLLQMSRSGAVMILVIAVVRALTVNKLPKKAFLALWGVVAARLLIPYSLPSAFSIYSLLGRLAPAAEAGTAVPTVPFAPAAPANNMIPQPVIPQPAAPAAHTPAVLIDPWMVVWLVGALVCAAFFAVAYLKCRREFKASLPVDNEYAERWLGERRIYRTIEIRQSGRISAPLTYGVFRPVILMPKTAAWDDLETLNYVLTHEYVHIRRFDAVTKLVLTAALCVHWFNPAVWIMYALTNRDIELSCDEAVIRQFGERTKSAYAMTLIRLEETRSGLTPLCNNFSKNAIEERIIAIMKMKKKSTAVIICAAMLVAGISAVFATSPKPTEAKNIEDLPSAVMTNTATTPASAPTEQDVPQNIPSVSDTSAAPQTTPVAPEQDVEPVKPVVEPSENTTEPQQTVQPEPAAPALENRWGVTDGEIPQWTEFLVESFEDAAELGKYLEATHGLYPGDYSSGHTYIRDAADLDLFLQTTSGLYLRDYIVGRALPLDFYCLQVHYEERMARNERLINGAYPVNSKGETYGSTLDDKIVGYKPDLVAVLASNGVSGYLTYNDYWWHGYPGPTPTDSMENMNAFWEWYKAQPMLIKLPVYDAEHENIVGYFEIHRSNKSDTDKKYGITPDTSLEEAREIIERGPQ